MSTKIVVGDALSCLRDLPDGSARCCVTSPPYWGLRDYGTAKWDGGDPECDHKGAPLASSSSSLAGYTSENVKIRTFTVPFKETCGKCGARRIDGQLGLERTPQEYVAAMVAVFREVRRVLADDGTLWLNLGDSYTGSGKGWNPEAGKQATNRGSQAIGTLYGKTGETARLAAVTNVSLRATTDLGMKPKDLVGIPWRVAFALQEDGWWLRSDIIWAKPNPMPESVTDRPTKAHEYLFLLSKSARYFYDAKAIAEPVARLWDETNGGSWAYGKGDAARVAERGKAGTHSGPYPLPGEDGLRNARTVWSIATSPFPDAHFATFPPELPRRCILAGSAMGDTVLDPFAGAGTTLLVADRLGRNGIGIELNEKYAEMARRRITSDAPLFNTEAP